MNSKTTAKDFFLYLGVMIGLYVSSISFLMLAFQVIDKLFPLTREYTGDFASSVRGSLAALIIFFPTFVYISYLENKDLIASPEKKDMWVRRWSIFFTLFVAGLTIAIDLTTLIYRFLGAEDLTTRFFLKVFFVLAVAITVLRSTLYDFKRESFEFSKNMKTRAIVVSSVVLFGIIFGMVLIGSPASQRARTLDEQRVSDLSSIQGQIVYMQWQNKGEVPLNLDSLKDPISGYTPPNDPEVNQSYEYRKISKNSFELCATFKTVATSDASDMNVARPISKLYTDGTTNENWQHGAERTCFTRVIDEKLYPINTKGRL